VGAARHLVEGSITTQNVAGYSVLETARVLSVLETARVLSCGP
jgi:hypothetical protein